MTAVVPVQRPAPDHPSYESWVLVERAQAGDSAAVGELFDRYVDMVFRYVYARVHNREVAEDLTSEVWMRVLSRIHGVTWQGRDFGTWLTTIARNIVVDRFKSGRYRFELTSDLFREDKVDAAPGPEDATTDYMRAREVWAAVQLLGDEQRQCVVLRFARGLSVTETAHVMGKTESAIKALTYRAMRRLLQVAPNLAEAR